MVDKNTPVGSEVWQVDYYGHEVLGPFLMQEHRDDICTVSLIGSIRPDGSQRLYTQTTSSLFPSRQEAVQALVNYLRDEIERLGA